MRATGLNAGLSRKGSAMAVDSEALLRVSHLTKTYPMPGSGFKRRSLPPWTICRFIAPGEVYGLVGESGSGKSTTGRLILWSRACGFRLDCLSRARPRHDVGAQTQAVSPARSSWYSQDSSTAFDPRNRVATLEEPLIIAGVRDADERHERALWPWLRSVFWQSIMTAIRMTFGGTASATQSGTGAYLRLAPCGMRRAGLGA